MKLPIITFAAILLGSAAFAQEATPAASASPKKDPIDEARFKKYDKDNDGGISLQEYIQGMGDEEKATRLFKNRDKDQDGKLSFEEFSSGKKAVKPAASPASSAASQ